MDTLILKLIDENDKEVMLDYIRELVEQGSKMDGVWYEEEESFEEMLYKLRGHEHVPFTSYEQVTPVNYQYLLIRESDNRMVGAVSIRPYLTRRLDEEFGGNVGYSIRPSERQKGYATEGLRLAVLKTKEYNPKDSVMVCCNRDNIGSRKAIINNGGRLIETWDGIIPAEKYLID